MIHDNDRSKVFNRRALFLGAGKGLLLSGLIARLYYLQVMEANRYHMLAEDNRVSLRMLLPPRGLILDRDGVPLAINQNNYRVLVIREQTPSLDYTLDALSKLIVLTDHDKARIIKEAGRRRKFMPVTVRENLSWEEVAKIEVNAPDLPGVVIDVGQSRHYPLESLGAHILGYVSAVSDEDLTGDPLEELPGFRVGKSGVEKVYDLALRGKHGTSSVEVNALGRVIRELERNEGEPGVELRLTLDMRLQEYAAQRLGEEAASVVVMDIHNGDTLVMASTPSFDPNAFNRGLTQSEWVELRDNPRSPLTNKAISGTFAPGSTFKMVVALAGLEAGVITPEHRIHCSGHTQLGNIRFHCWKKGGHGAMNMVDSLKHSCDIYYYELARRLGPDKISEMANRLGLGVPTGIDLPNERQGVMPTRAWKRSVRKEGWLPGESFNYGIGQGYALATPLQLAVMTARLANGGKAVVPHVARDLIRGKTIAPRPMPDWESCEINPAHLAVVKQGMFAVSNEQGGTAYRARIEQEGIWLCGKTGTAQVRRITMRERDSGVRKNEDLPWKERDHALFVAYAPHDNPRYAISVVVQHGGGGSAVAAPIARDVLIEVFKRERARMANSPEGSKG